MKAFLVTAESQSIDEIEIDGLDDIKTLIGFDTIDSDAIGTEGDRLYFDEECFLRGSSGRFQVDSVVPVSGKGIIVGTKKNGAMLSSAVTNLDDLVKRINYL